MSFLDRWFGSSAEKRCDEGLAALGRRDFAAAAQAFRDCVEEGDRTDTARLARFHLADCHAQMAGAAYRREEYDVARENIELSLAYASPTVERHLIAAQIARRLNDPLGAAYQLECVLSRAPEHEHAVALRAVVWYEEGHVGQAIALAESLPPVDGRLRRFREAHERGDRTAAVAHLDAVATGYATSLW